MNTTQIAALPIAPEEGGGPAEELAYRLNQQKLLAQFGLYALGCQGLDVLLHEAARYCAAGLQTDFSKVLEWLPAENRFLVCAGVGWGPEVVGHATIGADLESPAGYALKTGEPVISNHLEGETRFRTPKLLADYGLKRAINVIIRTQDKPFGVLEVDSPLEGKFTEADLAFMQGFANLLGVAIERKQVDAKRALLMRELNHRVKNLFAIVSGLVSVTARQARSPKEMAEALQGRILALARAHELIRPAITGEASAGARPATFEALAREVLAPHIEMQAAAEAQARLTGPEFVVGPNAASSLALVLHELATNAVKYGSLSVPEGRLDVRWQADADNVAVTWCERDGPPVPGPPAEAGFGTMLSRQSVTGQLGGRIDFDWQAEGLVVRLELPPENLGR